MAEADDQDQSLGELQVWAAEQLGLSHNGTLSSAKGAWLRSLAESDFLPATMDVALGRLLFAAAPLAADRGDPEDLQRIVDASYPALANAAMLHRGDAALEVARELFLHEQIDEFAAAFFSLAPLKRRAAWHELHSHALGFPRLVARVNALSPVLDLQPELICGGPPRADELRDQIARLSVMRPAARATARREFVAVAREDPKAWSKAARWLRRRREIATLDRGLLDVLVRQETSNRYDNVARFFGRAPTVVARGKVRPVQRASPLAVGLLLLAIVIVRSVLNHPSPPRPKVDPRSYETIRREAEALRRQLDRTSTPRNLAPESSFEIPPILEHEGFDAEEVRRGLEAYKQIEEIKRKYKGNPKAARQAIEELFAKPDNP